MRLSMEIQYIDEECHKKGLAPRKMTVHSGNLPSPAFIQHIVLLGSTPNGIGRQTLAAFSFTEQGGHWEFIYDPEPEILPATEDDGVSYSELDGSDYES